MVEQRTVGLLVAGLIVGVIGGYLVTSTQIESLRTQLGETKLELTAQINSLEEELTSLNQERSQYEDDINAMQDELDAVSSSYEQLKETYLGLQTDYDDLMDNYEALIGDYDALNYSYSALQETYELYNVNLYKEIPFNITRTGVGFIEETFDFDVGYGVIVSTFIRVETESSEVEIAAGCTWTRGGDSGFMGSSGRTYTQLETTLTGYAYCKIFDSGGGQIQVEVGVRPRNQTSWHGRECFGTFPKELS